MTDSIYRPGFVPDSQSSRRYDDVGGGWRFTLYLL